MEREADWLDDYALFRALRDRFASQPWWDWPDGLSTRAAVGAGRGPAKPRSARSASTPTCSGSPTRSGRRRARRRGIRLFGDLPFMVGADSADVWQHQENVRPRAVGRHAARRVQRRRPGLGPAGLSLGLRRARRLRLAARPGAARHGALRRLSRRSRDRLLPHLRARRGRRRPLHARGSGGAEGARAEDHAGLPGLRGGHPRRGSRHRPRLPAPVAERAGRARLQGVPLGARLEDATGSPSSIRDTTPRCRSRPPARTTPRASPSGGTPRRARSASRR